MDFDELATRYRRELQVHCYRIVGSVQDAEDLVQEALVAAWRGRETFEGRASPRTWLYRIATNLSLNAVRDRSRRPVTVGPPPDGPVPPDPTGSIEPLWLEPYPDALADGPHERYELREAIGLAFMTALQRLPARQRAVLVLRDVLGFRASEVADMLDVSESAVMSALHRARTGLEPVPRSDAPAPDSPEERRLVDAFADAFQAGDVDGVVGLLTVDARLTMPPEPFEYVGREAIGAFLSTVPAGGRLDLVRLVETRANGQPAFGCYLDGHAYGLMAITLDREGISAITGFRDPSVFRFFDLPRALGD